MLLLLLFITVVNAHLILNQHKIKFTTDCKLEGDRLWVIQGKIGGFLPLQSGFSYFHGECPSTIPHAHVDPSFKYPQSKYTGPCQHLMIRDLNQTYRNMCGDAMNLSISEKIVWIDFIGLPATFNDAGISLKGHAGATNTLLVNGETNQGEGITVMVVDTGLDPYHDMFLDPGQSFPTGSLGSTLSASSHSKIRGILTSHGTINRVDGSHGTAVAGLAVGYESMGVSGTAPESK